MVSRVRFIRTTDGPARRAERLLAAGRASLTRSEDATHVVADYRGRCVDPWCLREVTGAVQERFVCDVIVRCRRCRPCLRQRKREWIARALVECERAERTWFVTLTIRPEWRYRLSAMAQAADGDGWHRRTDAARHRLRLMQLLALHTVWMKRLRMRGVRRAGAEGRPAPKVRYLCVAEQHPSSGEWHLHVLVHERGGQLRESDIRHTWGGYGFARAKLVRQGIRAAVYVASYLEADASNRQRASLRYGKASGMEVRPAGQGRSEEAITPSGIAQRETQRPAPPQHAALEGGG